MISTFFLQIDQRRHADGHMKDIRVVTDVAEGVQVHVCAVEALRARRGPRLGAAQVSDGPREAVRGVLDVLLDPRVHLLLRRLPGTGDVHFVPRRVVGVGLAVKPHAQMQSQHGQVATEIGDVSPPTEPSTNLPPRRYVCAPTNPTIPVFFSLS